MNADKILTITNGKTGDIVFQKHRSISFGYKEKDIKIINSAIKKLNK